MLRTTLRAAYGQNKVPSFRSSYTQAKLVEEAARCKALSAEAAAAAAAAPSSLDESGHGPMQMTGVFGCMCWARCRHGGCMGLCRAFVPLSGVFQLA